MMIDGLPEHITKRDSPAGRWLPVSFYAANYLLWTFVAAQAESSSLLWLAVFPLPALMLYWVRTGRKTNDG
jgi:hypothetical protein